MRVSVWCAVLLLGCGTVAAQNMVANSEFDADVLAWSPISSQTTLTWSGDHDYSGDPMSGSALVTHVYDQATLTGPIQCVPSIPDGEPHDLSAWVRIPSGQPSTGHASFLVMWWTEANCQGTSTNGLWPGNVTTEDAWVHLSAPTETPPAGTRSARVYLAVHKDTASSVEYQVFFDQVIFSTPTVLFFDGFERGDTAEWVQ